MYIGIVQEFVQLIKRILPQGFISYGKSNNNSKSNFGWGGWADYGACDDSDVHVGTGSDSAQPGTRNVQLELGAS